MMWYINKAVARSGAEESGRKKFKKALDKPGLM